MWKYLITTSQYDFKIVKLIYIYALSEPYNI